jgi:hypothetical protein
MKIFTRTAWCLFASLLLHTADAKADPVLDWNLTMVATVRDLPPPLQNRFAAIMHLAVFEAVNAVSREFEPYLGTVSPPAGTSAHAAAIAAGHAVLKHYFPQRAPVLDSVLADSLSVIAQEPGMAAGIAVGESAARLMIEARANDGSATALPHLPASSRPGEWQLTPGCPATGGVFQHWRHVKPFAIRDRAQFGVDPPPALTEHRYAEAYAEVKAVGGSNSARRSQDHTDVARFYAGFGDVVLWSDIARQIAAARGTSLAHNARTFALVSMALSDAGVTLADAKYKYRFWRPETAIRAAAGDGNRRTEPDPDYVPLIRTPCHPSYPSGHAATSYAAREVIERTFGESHAITLSSPTAPGVTLEYQRLEEITDDVDDARVYGGVHFRFDQEAGAQQGRRVGAFVHQHVLRPLYAGGAQRGGGLGRYD